MADRNAKRNSQRFQKNLSRLQKRVKDILEAAEKREAMGQHYTLTLSAQFELRNRAAVQYEIVLALLEEGFGLTPEEIVTEIFKTGMVSLLEAESEEIAPTAVRMKAGVNLDLPSLPHEGVPPPRSSRIRN